MRDLDLEMPHIPYQAHFEGHLEDIEKLLTLRWKLKGHELDVY